MYFGSFFSARRKVSLIISWFRNCCFYFFSLIFKSVGREREVFVRGARLSFVSAEINEAQGRHRAAGDEPTKKYRIRVQLKISRHLRKIQKIKIGSTWLDSNPGQKILDQLELIKIQKIKIGSTWLDSNLGQKILDQLELIKIQKKNIGSTWLDSNPGRKILDQIDFPELIFLIQIQRAGTFFADPCCLWHRNY